MSRGFIIFSLTALTLIAFAANSVLTRLALANEEIGAWSFILIRILSGSFVLALLVSFKDGFKQNLKQGNWAGSIALLCYGVFFSYAYLLLATGTGALILFAAVQLTMLGWGFLKGERLSSLQWVGFVMSVVGLFYLLSPALEAPSILGSMLMIMAGLGWGAYSILGKGAGDPTAQTAGNFIRASFMLIPLTGLVVVFSPEFTPTPKGWTLAIISGGITSGLGYALWYAVLKLISVTKAGIAQLTVPAIAALGGVLFVNEPLTLRFVLATTIILTGVALATLTQTVKARP